MKKANSKNSVLKWIIIVILLLMIYGIAGFGFYFFYMNPQNQGAFTEGILGLINANYIRLLIVFTVFVVLMLVASWILHRHKNEKKFLRVLTRIVCLVPAIIVGVFVLKNFWLDLPKITAPQTILLKNVEWDKKDNNHNISGIDQDGNPKTYHLNTSTYNALTEKWENKEAFSTLKVLPYNQIVMSVQVDDHLSQKNIKNMVYPSEMSDDWQRLQVQINKKVYALNEPLSNFLDNDWVVDETSYESKQHENLEAGKSQDLLLTNRDGRQVALTVKNTTKETQEIAKASVVKIVLNNVDSGFYYVLPSDIVLGWSHDKEILKTYGEPKETKETEWLYDSENGSMRLVFTDQGILDGVTMSSK